MSAHGQPEPDAGPDTDEWPDPDLVSALTETLSRINTTKVTPEALADALSWRSPGLLRPGRLRPYVTPNAMRPGTKYWEYPPVVDRALNLLLYAHEVIVDHPSYWASFEPGETDDETTKVVRSLVDVWDLVDDESLLVRDMDTHPMWDAPMTQAEVMEFGLTEAEYEHWTHQVMALEYWDNQVTPWLLTNQDARVTEILLERALVSGADRRALQLPKLAALDLPSLSLHTADLVAVRRNSDTFGEWRQHLGAALSQVEQLPESDAWQRDARAIIADELTPYTERVRAETAQSTALSTSVVGVKQLAIAGIGSAVGAMADGTTGALAGLGSAGAMTLVSNFSDWVKARREAVPDRAVLKLAMVFDPRTP